MGFFRSLFSKKNKRQTDEFSFSEDKFHQTENLSDISMLSNEPAFTEKAADSLNVKDLAQLETNTHIATDDKDDCAPKEVSITGIDYVKSVTQSKNGLLIPEILMLHYAHNYSTNEKHFPSFWVERYYIDDPWSLLESLKERGFLKIADLSNTIEHLKVPQLKETLKAAGQKVSGRKSELVDRLLSLEDISIIEEKYPERYYALTDLGKQELQENEQIVLQHRDNKIFEWQIIDSVQSTNGNINDANYRDSIWRELNEKSKLHYANMSPTLYRKDRLSMYYLLMDEARPKPALPLLCEVALYDLNKLHLYYAYKKGHYTEKELLELKLEYFPSNGYYDFLQHETIIEMEYIKDLLEFSHSRFRSAILENFNKIEIPDRIFTNDECAEIVLAEICNHQDIYEGKLKRIYEIAEKRLKDQITELE